MNVTTNIPPLPQEFFRDEFIKLAQFSPDFPYGLAIFDRELRHILVNEHMAAISKTPIEQYKGRTIREVAPGVAVAMEPVLRHVMDKGEQLLDVEVEIPGLMEGDVSDTSCWLINCYPFKSGDGKVQGIATIARDISGQKTKDTAQEELLKFEAILSELSAAFINIPISEVDRKIEQGLQKIVDFLGFDRCSIWQFSTDDGRLHCTHSYALPGIKQPAPIVDDVVPVWTSMTLRGEIFKVSDVDELTDEFWREKQYCKDMGGIKSFLFIPLNVGGTVVGLLSFASCHAKKLWPDLLIQRLRLFWDIIGNALERKRADQMIQKALAEIRLLKDRLEAENLYLRDQIDVEYKHEEIVGQSDAVRKVLLKAEQVAHTDSTVLILGETGTGKELVARAIHNMSGRRGRAMIKLNCAALPATLIEAELFGREKGAYTGASTTQIGRFEAANGSTIFLDEIGELPLELQSKLLRVLQEGQFERLGSTRPIEVDVRVIAATNRDLAQAVRQGNFREDLYYRLNVFPIGVPPLRERSEDVPALVWAMVKEFGKVFGKSIERIPKKNMDALRSYHWPGNVRELRNMIERAMILNNGTTLVVELPDTPSTISSQATSLEEMERMHILAVMGRCGWRVRGKHGAAEILRLKPTTLDSKMKKLGIRRNPLISEIS